MNFSGMHPIGVRQIADAMREGQPQVMNRMHILGKRYGVIHVFEALADKFGGGSLLQ